MKVSAKEGLRLRSGPNTQSTALKLIPYADEVTVIGTDRETEIIGGVKGKWANVVWEKNTIQERKRLTGWVFDAFLSEQVEVTPEFVRSQITFTGVIENTAIKIPAINNKIMGIEPPPPMAPDEKACILEDFGYAFIFSKDYKISNNITIEAYSGSKSFSRAISNDSLDRNDSNRIYFYFPFENKHWLQTTEWCFVVKDGVSEIYNKEMGIPVIQFLIYIKRSDDPFEICQIQRFYRNSQYTFDQKTGDIGVIVFYYTQHWNVYDPVLVLNMPAGSVHTGSFRFQFEFSATAPPGAFYIQKYTMEQIPKGEPVEMAIFGSYHLD
ncbi:MAG: SH3 domain-containing protein [Spirochaetales bacterium]|nr:SH3 domain-containing protein [Spirochaetales bacterium]